MLQNFPADDLRRRFEDYLNKLAADFDFGKVERAPGDRQGEEEARRGARGVQIGIIIGGADGNFDKDEQAVVREACFALDLPPHEFDL